MGVCVCVLGEGAAPFVARCATKGQQEHCRSGARRAPRGRAKAAGKAAPALGCPPADLLEHVLPLGGVLLDGGRIVYSAGGRERGKGKGREG